jgi:HEAT repeat protein
VHILIRTGGYSVFLSALGLAAMSSYACLPIEVARPCPEQKLDKMSSAGLANRVIEKAESDDWLASCAAGALAKRGPKALPTLLELIKNKDDKTQRIAMGSLFVMGDKAAPAVPTLLALMQSPVVDIKTRDSALGALTRIGDKAASAVPAFMKLASSRDEMTAWMGIWGLDNIGKSATPAIPLLAQIAMSDDPTPIGLSVQNFAATTLGNLGQYDPDTAVPYLVKLLKRPGLEGGVAEGIMAIGPVGMPWSSELQTGLIHAFDDAQKRESELTKYESQIRNDLIGVRNLKDQLRRALTGIPDDEVDHPK